MDFEKCKSVAKNDFKYKKQARELLLGQISNFENCVFKTKENQYKIGDEVILSENTLIHGTRVPVAELDVIAQNGLVASEFLSKKPPYKKKKPYIVDFWDINKKTLLKDYINTFANGVTIEFTFPGGKIERAFCGIDEIKKTIQGKKGFRIYRIYQNQEQRFLPNDVVDCEVTVAFILNYPKNDVIIKNDIFADDFDKKITKQILPKWFFNKYVVKKEYDESETDREKAILFGVPACYICGIIVNRQIEKSKTQLKAIKKCFPNCYICNIDGVVIY